MSTEAKTTMPVPRTMRDLFIVLGTAAASWGAVKVELNNVVKAETAMATIALRSDAAGVIADRIDSAMNLLEHRTDARFDTLRADLAAQLASLPEPETITRTVLIPGPPDSALAEALTEHIATIDNAAQELAREGARQRTQFNEWKAWIMRNGFLQRSPDKRNGDGH